LLQVARLAGEHGLRVAPHTWSDAVAVVANAQVVASLPNGITVEMDRTGNPFIDELLVEPLEVREGQLQLSRAPGLGIELNWKTAERLRMPDPLHLADGAYSDMAFGPAYFTQAPAYAEAR
jgi:L-alanine-DL-glutamate epimerase-like enolase superfamily enzyme